MPGAVDEADHFLLGEEAAVGRSVAITGGAGGAEPPGRRCQDHSFGHHQELAVHGTGFHH